MWWHHLKMKIRDPMWSFPVTSFTVLAQQDQRKPRTSTKGHSMHKAVFSHFCKENRVQRRNQEELDQGLSWFHSERQEGRLPSCLMDQPKVSTRVLFVWSAGHRPAFTIYTSSYISRGLLNPNHFKHFLLSPLSVNPSTPVFDWWKECGRNLAWMFWCA